MDSGGTNGSSGNGRFSSSTGNGRVKKVATRSVPGLSVHNGAKGTGRVTIQGYSIHISGAKTGSSSSQGSNGAKDIVAGVNGSVGYLQTPVFHMPVAHADQPPPRPGQESAPLRGVHEVRFNKGRRRLTNCAAGIARTCTFVGGNLL